MTGSTNAISRSLQSKSFQRRLTIGFATTVAVTALIAIAATFVLHDVVANKDSVIYNYGQDLILTERLRYTAEKKISLFRGYYLTRADFFLQDLQENQKQFEETISQLRENATPEEREDLDEILKLNKEYDAINQELIEKMQKGEQVEQLALEIAAKVRPFRQKFEIELTKLVDIESKQLEDAKAESIQSTQRNFILIAVITAVAILLSGILAFVLSRTLNQLYQRALRATRVREEMLGIVAHDLKNPIASVGVISALMKRSLLSPGDSKRLIPTLDRLDRVTDKMSRLIDDLLVVDKIESGIFSLALKTEDVKAILADVVDSFSPIAQERSIDLKTNFANDLGEIHCDRDRLHQVFANLIGNALKFTPTGGTITFKAEKIGQQVSFQIEDTGPGIPAEQLPRLFERHWQAKETAQNGNGLGLYIAQNIVRAHGGDIGVTSSRGKGAAFAFHLPVKPTLVI